MERFDFEELPTKHQLKSNSKFGIFEIGGCPKPSRTPFYRNPTSKSEPSSSSTCSNHSNFLSGTPVSSFFFSRSHFFR
ncbi:hypothetical protein ACFX19_020906 [Malus domestica]